MNKYINFNDWDIEEDDNIPECFRGHEKFYDFLIEYNIYNKWYNVIMKNFMDITAFFIFFPNEFDFINAVISRTQGEEKILWIKVNKRWEFNLYGI